MWQAIRHIDQNAVVIGRSLGNKKLKPMKDFPEFPWSEPSGGPQKVGDRSGFTAEEVMEFLG